MNMKEMNNKKTVKERYKKLTINMSFGIFLVLFQTQYNISIFFFFSSRRRHTRLQGDWSSDVCSSDLPRRGAEDARAAGVIRVRDALARDVRRRPAASHQGRAEERRVGKECRSRWS